MGLLRWMRGGAGDDVADFHDSTLQSLILSTELQQLVGLGTQAALGVAAVFRARQLNADTLAALPLQAGDTLLPAPNRDQSMQEAVAEIVLSMEDCGDAYLRVTADGFRVLNPGRMVVTWSNDRNRRREYRYKNVKLRTTGLTRNLVVVSMNRTAADLTGTGPMESSAIGGAVALQQYAQQYFENSGQPTGILTTPSSMTPDEARLLKEQWMKARGVRTPAVLTGGMTWSGEGFSPSDSEWVEGHMANIGDVANLFGVPGTMLNYNQPGSALVYSGVAGIYQQYWRQTLKPTYATRIQAAIGSIYEVVAEFDPAELFLASIQDRAQAASVLANSGYDHEAAATAVGLPPLPAQPAEVTNGAI